MRQAVITRSNFSDVLGCEKGQKIGSTVVTRYLVAKISQIRSYFQGRHKFFISLFRHTRDIQENQVFTSNKKSSRCFLLSFLITFKQGQNLIPFLSFYFFVICKFYFKKISLQANGNIKKRRKNLIMNIYYLIIKVDDM